MLIDLALKCAILICYWFCVVQQMPSTSVASAGNTTQLVLQMSKTMSRMWNPKSVESQVREKAITDHFIGQGLPLRMIDTASFKHMCRTLAPKFVVPGQFFRYIILVTDPPPNNFLSSNYTTFGKKPVPG